MIGTGNAWRSDDGAGLAVARLLQRSAPEGVDVILHEGEPTSLLPDFDGAASLWLVDAVSSGAPPGTVHRLDAGEGALPEPLFRTSSHHVGLAEAIELARTLGRLPRRTVVYGIEGARFETGETLSPEVERAVAVVVEAIRSELG